MIDTAGRRQTKVSSRDCTGVECESGLCKVERSRIGYKSIRAVQAVVEGF